MDAWVITIKSDLFSIGKTVLEMMVGSMQPDAWLNEEHRNMVEGGVKSFMPIKYHEMPGVYSAGLFMEVEKMLSFNPNMRPDLQVLTKTIDENLARLDRQFGDGIKKPPESIDPIHRVRPPKRLSVEEGEKFEPVKKRKVEQQWRQSHVYNPNEGRREHAQLRNTWNSARYTIPTLGEFEEIIELLSDPEVVDLMNEEYEDFITREQITDAPDAIITRGLDILYKRIAPSARHISFRPKINRQEFAPDRIQALTSAADKYFFLHALYPALTEIRPQLTRNMYEVLRHGVDWGLAILKTGTVPFESQEALTEWHRAVLDVIRWYPTAVWRDEKEGDNEGDDEGGDNDDDDYTPSDVAEAEQLLLRPSQDLWYR
jgi:hypothetical protein